MKISVITLHSVCNYGTQLQALATQEKLKEYFSCVEFVNYRRPNTYGIKLMKTFSGNNPIKMLAILPTLLKWKKTFGSFQKKYLNISKEDYHKINSDAYFTGSDQVWNTGWNKGVIPEFYLDFVPDNIPKYSYSSSFGITKLEDNEKIKEYLKRFNRITVREESSLNILKDLDIKGERILDPTLVMDKEYWRSIAPKSKIKENYILIYNLNRSKEFDKYCEEFSKKTGLKLYRFCTRYDQIFRNGKSLLVPNILEFITLIDNAKYVITDSFHATAFSINMNTIPVVLYPKDYSNRLSDFLKLVNLEECHPKDYNDFSIINKNIKFSKSNKILDLERKKVDKYLQKIKEEMSIKKPLISVIVPVYNGEKYLDDCIKSILNQDYTNIEVILINDGSKDNSLNIMKKYESIDKRIRIINQENSGVSISRNKALKISKGEYICFVDQDDCIVKNYISYFYNLITKTNAEIALTPTAYKFTGNINYNYNVESSDYIVVDGKKAVENMLYYKYIISPWNKMIKHSLIEQNNIQFDKRFFSGEGFLFSIQAFYYSKKVVEGKESPYLYRCDNTSSGMTKYSESIVKSSIAAQKEIKKFLLKDKTLEQACAYANWHTHYDLLNTMIGCNVVKKNKELYKKLKQETKKDALISLKSPINTKEKIKGLMYFINPFIAAKIINKLRVRKYTKED